MIGEKASNDRRYRVVGCRKNKIVNIRNKDICGVLFFLCTILKDGILSGEESEFKK